MTDIAAKLAAPFEVVVNRRTGTETIGVAIARFFASVAVRPNPAECWLWQGPRLLNEGGEYGRFWFNGGEHRAHRFLYEAINGELAGDLLVRHICDNPPCVNPAHLIAGTSKDNRRDMFERGRGPNRKGERHPLARLTDDDVRRIRALADAGLTHPDIAVSFGMSRQQIYKIIHRINWGHVL
jgi:uncharacterized protein YjiS (DUF1127 family)